MRLAALAIPNNISAKPTIQPDLNAQFGTSACFVVYFFVAIQTLVLPDFEESQ
jgi:hypothetical protein